MIRGVLVVLLMAVMVAGCGGGSSPSVGPSPTADPHPTHTHRHSPTPSPPVTVTASTSATATVTPSPTPSPSHHHAAACLTSQLKLSLGQSQGAAGNFYTPLILTNDGSSACTVFGFPGVSYLNSHGAEVGLPAAEQKSPEATIVVKPGAAASALLHQPNPLAFPASDCHKTKAAAIRVYPPSQKAPLVVDSSMLVCTTAQGRSDVTAMQRGTNPQL